MTNFPPLFNQGVDSNETLANIINQLITAASERAVSEGIIYDNGISGLEASDVKKAIDELVKNIGDISDNLSKQIDLKAPVESPALKGSPTTPLPTKDDGIANKKFVEGLINDITFPITDYKCIIKGSSTGAKNEIQDINLGTGNGVVSSNSRYIITNPFGNNIPIIVLAEVLVNGKWANSGWLYDGISFGTKASYVQNEGIIIQTGSTSVCAVSNEAGGGHGTTTSANSASCRIHVWRIKV